MEDKMKDLKERMTKVQDWRKLGKSFSVEQQVFADELVDDMLTMKNINKMGVQVVSRVNMDFMKSKELPTKESDVASAPKMKGQSAEESGSVPRKSADIASIKPDAAPEQAEGEVKTLPAEDVGHQPELPMPKKMAEELIENAKWGVSIGAYTTIKEGIARQLSRKAYEEFVDSPEKMEGVLRFLEGIQA